METVTKSFNILVLGPAGSGKTAFMHRICTGEFFSKRGEDRFFSYTMHTTRGVFTLNLYEFTIAMGASTNIISPNWDGMLIFFDMTNHQSADIVVDFLQRVRARYPDGTIPICICGNKVDQVGLQLTGSADSDELESSDEYKYTNHLVHERIRLDDHTVFYMTSAKSNYNFDKPYISLLRKMTHNADLEWTEE